MTNNLCVLIYLINSNFLSDSVAKAHKDSTIMEISAAISEQIKRIGQRYRRSSIEEASKSTEPMSENACNKRRSNGDSDSD